MRALSVLPTLWAFLAPSPCWAEDSSAAAGKEAVSLTFNCGGRTSDEKSLASFASAGEAKFEVSATFGEGAIVALLSPETNAVLGPLYDAETTTGHLSFSDGEETTIVWTRMSGVDGILVGEAITSDGDVLTLTIERGAKAVAQRPFVLFAAASASLFRGTCGAAVHR